MSEIRADNNSSFSYISRNSMRFSYPPSEIDSLFKMKSEQIPLNQSQNAHHQIAIDDIPYDNMSGIQIITQLAQKNTFWLSVGDKAESQSQQQINSVILPQEHYSGHYANAAEDELQIQYSDHKIKNQTKNIPKNYGKAIISFIERYIQIVDEVTAANGVNPYDFLAALRAKKKTVNTIADLRSMWVDFKYAKCMRILSSLFLRRYSLNYIFNSRVCNHTSHIKYRHRLSQALKNPDTFKHIKDY